MGSVIIDLKTKFLAFAEKGKVAAFGKEISALKKHVAQQKGMKVRISPLAEGAACVTLCFKGSMETFDDIMSELDK